MTEASDDDVLDEKETAEEDDGKEVDADAVIDFEVVTNRFKLVEAPCGPGVDRCEVEMGVEVDAVGKVPPRAAESQCAASSGLNTALGMSLMLLMNGSLTSAVI